MLNYAYAQADQSYQQRLKRLLQNLREAMRAEISSIRPPNLTPYQLQEAKRLENERPESASTTPRNYALFAGNRFWLDDTIYIRLWRPGDLCAIKDAPQFFSAAGRERTDPQGSSWLRAVVVEFDEAYSGLVCLAY